MSNMSKSNNKRIAKNTIILYIRSFLVMLIGLYTSRIILKALGIEDYGLYNVVGGVVSLFSFLRTSMTKSTQRFLNVEMVKENGCLSDTFRVSLTLHIIIALFALIITETFGLWFLNTHIQIPEGREWAANMVYQSTVVSLIITIITVPYSASIIAHEKMGFFALISIVDAVLKLGIAFLILIDTFDKLVFYAYLLMAVNVINLIMYMYYCKTKLGNKTGILFDSSRIKEMLGYTTWTVVGQTAIVGTNQGNNILVNMFHSVTANAAMGIASQMNNAIVSLTANFQTAFNPQITKSYAQKDYEYLKFLIFSTSKISYLLLTFVSIPIVFNIDTILGVWLTVVPEYAGVFCILVLCNSILNAVSAPLNFTVLSSKNIKWFQICTSIVYFSDLVILYILFSLGFPAVTALCVKVSIMVVIWWVRLYYCSKEVNIITFSSYIKDVVLPLFASTVLSVSAGLCIFSLINGFVQQLIGTLILSFVSIVLAYFIGLNKPERNTVSKLLKKITKR